MKTRISLLELVLVLLVAAPTSSRNTPWEPTEWNNHQRELLILLSEKINTKPVHRSDTTEPDPTQGEEFTLGDAVWRAAAAWGAANTGWSFIVTTDEALAEGRDGVVVVKLEPFPSPDLPQSASVDIHEYLAIFRVTDLVAGHAIKGEIIFNDYIPNWSIGPNSDGVVVYDPIVVALHELGHAISLDDIEGEIGNPKNGAVLRCMILENIHETNKTPDFKRYPSQDDINAAKESARIPPPPVTPGWFNSPSSTCTTGAYVIGNPTLQTSSGVTTQPEGSASGTRSIFTATNSSAGSNDVDGGNCILVREAISVPTTSTLSFNYFHGQRDTGDDPSGDFFNVQYRVDGGNWITVISNGDSTSNAAWTTASTMVPAGSVELRMQCSDGAGAGDLIECGIDDVKICN